MTIQTEPLTTPEDKIMNTGTLDALLDSMARQADAWRREAGNAVVANHPLEEQYCLGMGAGLKMAASMLQSVSNMPHDR